MTIRHPAVWGALFLLAVGPMHQDGTPASSASGVLEQFLAGFGGGERRDVLAGKVVVEVPRADGEYFVVQGAGPTVADGGRLAEWHRHVAELRRSRYVPSIQRFSSPPVLDDLADLVLDRGDLDDLRNCQPGDCGLQLAADEIGTVREAIAAGGRSWRDAATDAFRRIMLARARAYLAGGIASVPLPADSRDAIAPSREFEALLETFAGDPLLTSPVQAYLRNYPRHGGDVESYLYWSKEKLGDVKPIVAITHLSIHDAGAARHVVTSAQVFATHYLDASVGYTAVLTAASGEGYLVYRRRVRADVLDSTFGGLIRRVVNRRVRSIGPRALEGLRTTIEQPPPSLR